MTKMTTSFVQPPNINLSFNQNLLKFGCFDKLQNLDYELSEIIKLANKKIRNQDVGKKREIERLLITHRGYHERAKIKKEIYEKAIENAKKMSRLSNAGPFMRFKRFQS